MARPPATEQVQVNFRMPADLKDRIEAAAKANRRTTTAELVARLEATFHHPTKALLHRIYERNYDPDGSAEDPASDPSDQKTTYTLTEIKELLAEVAAEIVRRETGSEERSPAPASSFPSFHEVDIEFDRSPGGTARREERSKFGVSDLVKRASGAAGQGAEPAAKPPKRRVNVRTKLGSEEKG